MSQLLLKELIENYNSLIQRDHHKDRDCHFYIKREWSYGEETGWLVEHYGYYHKENQEGLSEPFTTYGYAEEHLKKLLIQWIKEEEEKEDDFF